ncbi:hypothetical protein RIF29_15201 [Crotalaria pallida]|uniref:Uncharacterized protein n=1 Tax=Crotalaria pallida TaxID=3830 RepID=A0AAN9FIJ8_CROPI
MIGFQNLLDKTELLHGFLFQMWERLYDWYVDFVIFCLVSLCQFHALVDATSSDSNLKEETGVRMVALFDHEECGSDSAQGAGSPVVLNALSRITNSVISDPKAGLALGELQSIGDLYDFNSVATLFLIGVVSVTPLLIFSALDALPTI